MKKAFAIVAAVVLVFVAGVLVLAATRPNDFTVTRSASIQAPPERIHAYLDDFRKWGAWSPWEKMDPAMKRRLGGAQSGKGSVYEWESDKVGTGRMEMTESSPARVAVKLDFLKPFEGHNTASFALEPAGGATKVTWSMQGPMNYVAKVIGVFCDMDAMIGKDFEAGLASLKSVSEKQAPR
jgi:polyketide cyclase/dehydrase/lipid transport protein